MKNLKNRVLISMPHMQDPYFARSVVFMCEHNTDGAMGLIINKPFDRPELKQLFANFFKDDDHLLKVVPRVHFGGPIMVERGIVLHSSGYQNSDSIKISNDFFLTNSKTILTDIARDKGPEYYRLFLGHAGWSPGQLEREIENGDWLLQETSPDFVFQMPERQMWKAAAQSFGIDLSHFTGFGGQA